MLLCLTAHIQKVACTSVTTCCATPYLQVQAANDVVYEDVAAGFTQLCSSLLPALEVQLERTATLAHEGLQFRWEVWPPKTCCDSDLDAHLRHCSTVSADCMLRQRIGLCCRGLQLVELFWDEV